MKLAMPVEKSGQTEFDFEYGDEFGAHIERFDPDFVKVLVRYNPDGDPDLNGRQAERLRAAVGLAAEHGRSFLFELLVPAEEEQLASVDGDTERYDAELRPELMIRRDRRASGRRGRARRVEDRGHRSARGLRAGRRRSAEPADAIGSSAWSSGAAPTRAKVEHWLHQRRRRRWLRRIRDRPLDLGRAAGRVPRRRLSSRDQAAEQVADNYVHFVEVYESATASGS